MAMQRISLSTAFGRHMHVPRLMSDEEMCEYNEREEQRKMEGRFKLSGIPKRYQKAELCDCDLNVQDWVETGLRDGSWLVISGPNGTGKTHQACAVANAVIRNDAGSVKFATMGKILGELYDTYGTPERAESVLYRYSKCRLLVLDDFGKEHMTASGAEKVFRIIDERWTGGRPTIITTNLTSKGLRHALTTPDGDEVAKAVIDRIADRGNTFVRLEGKSLRR